MSRRLGGPGFDVVERARKTIEREGMLERGQTVVAAVSGGPDSMCLLDVLLRLQDPLDLDVQVAHVDHGLSDESARIAARVANHAAQLGLEVHVVRAPDLSGPNLQARAREFRYGFFDIVAERIDADAIATAHTLDDRVETTLARLLHGAPPEGLAGIRPMDGNRIRPLIEIRRSETRAYCEAVGIELFDDPANLDDRFERVKVRERLVRTIEDEWGDGAVRAIARSAARLAEDSDALAAVAERLFADLREGDANELDLAALLAMPRALRRRLLEHAVGRVRDRHGGIDAVLDALETRPPSSGKQQSFAVASGIEITITADKVRVSRLDQ